MLSSEGWALLLFLHPVDLFPEVRTGDAIISGCVNMTGLLKVQTPKEFG